jgi:hypothetical protein
MPRGGGSRLTAKLCAPHWPAAVRALNIDLYLHQQGLDIGRLGGVAAQNDQKDCGDDNDDDDEPKQSPSVVLAQGHFPLHLRSGHPADMRLGTD